MPDRTHANGTVGAWRLTCQRARIRGLHFHDLRREFGCQLLEAGASLHLVRDYLGHANITRTNTYLSTNADTWSRP